MFHFERSTNHSGLALFNWPFMTPIAGINLDLSD